MTISNNTVKSLNSKNLPTKKKVIRKSKKLNHSNSESYRCLISELTDVYKTALQENNLAVALKALEIKAKYLQTNIGLSEKSCKKLKEMSDQELIYLLDKEKEQNFSSEISKD